MMLIHHTKPREDLNDGEKHEAKPFDPMQVMHKLMQVRQNALPRTWKVRK